MCHEGSRQVLSVGSTLVTTEDRQTPKRQPEIVI
jgi:hypothetical protein